MKEPVLVIMAAGMGSRFGGLKQIEPVGNMGEIILDFSLYDAMLAGFDKAVFVIKKENEADFRALIDEREGKHMKIEYAYQSLKDLPEGFEVPSQRQKPWGTAHAVYAARDYLDGPFAVINADDYYGPNAFQKIYDFLSTVKDDDKYRYCMVGYNIENTITENGYVSRGVCHTSPEGYLDEITERTKIKWQGEKIVFSEDNEKTWQELKKGTTVSMNLWGFTESVIKEMGEMFPSFLEGILKENPLKGEFFLPGVVDKLIKEDKASVKVLKSEDRWYGVTYKEDKDSVVCALQSMKDKGLYPEKLWK